METAGYMSFLVRLWPARAADGSSRCVAEVEHIQSGRCWNFLAASDAWEFLCAATNDPQLLIGPANQQPGIDRGTIHQ